MNLPQILWQHSYVFDLIWLNYTCLSVMLFILKNIYIYYLLLNLILRLARCFDFNFMFNLILLLNFLLLFIVIGANCK